MPMIVHIDAREATNDTVSPRRSGSTKQPTYRIIDYVTLNEPQRYQAGGPALVITLDYLSFYAAGQAAVRPLPILGYEILHCYPHTTNLIGARAHYIAWKSTLWRTPGNHTR
jgi:hypothetical protein